MGLLSAVVASPFRRGETMLMDSLRAVHPRLRAAWLTHHGYDVPDGSRSLTADSEGFRVVGRWSYGPASDVDGLVTPAETLIALARGSGVSLLRFSCGESVRVELLADINSAGLTYQVMLRDTLLLVSTGGGLEVYSIANVHQPSLLTTIPPVFTGFDVRDSLLYALDNDDTFRVYSLAEPSAPRQLGVCRDSGGSVSVAGITAFIAEGGGLYAIDVSNPASPHRVGSYPGWAISATARGNICCVTWGNSNEPTWLRFSVLDVSDPTNMYQLGYIDSCGGYDTYLEDSLVFISGYYTGGHEFQVVSLADSTHPVRVGGCTTLGYGFGVWANAPAGAAFVADDYGGLDVINISNLTRPRADSVALRVGFAKDLSIDGNFCYIASEMAGLKVLDVSVPSVPVWVGDIDTAGGEVVSWSVVAKDSFAYASWRIPWLRSVDVSDPAHPQMAGSCNVTAAPQSMVLRDSLLYAAENGIFEIANVARPRTPVVVGTLVLPDYSYGMCLQDSLAYVSTYPLAIIDVANPAQPETIGSIPRGTWSVFVKDTLAYLAAVGLHVWNVTNPASPTPVDSLTFGHMVYDVVVVDSLAYLACSDGLRLANVADPHNMRVLALRSLPYIGWRLAYDSPYVYVATQEAGICIFETTAVGVAGTGPRRVNGALVVRPNPVGDYAMMRLPAVGADIRSLRIYDVSGRFIQSAPVTWNAGEFKLDMTALSPGLYVARIEGRTQVWRTKIVRE